MKGLNQRIKKSWVSPVGGEQSQTTAAWTINKDGSVSQIRILKHGSSTKDDQAALQAIKNAAPFAPLPQGAPTTTEVQYCFATARPNPLGLTVGQALKKFGTAARARLRQKFAEKHVFYPPENATILCLKEERLLLLFAGGKQIASYPLVSFSGLLGPKLKEGDMQIPEGFYKPTSLDASTHLCLWVNYPNQSDRAHAALEHRTNLGGAIQIHEGIYSTGCLVIDHEPMAELFMLAHEIGCHKIELIIAPCNLLTKSPTINFALQPAWLPQLYRALKQSLGSLPIDQGAGQNAQKQK
jgi:TonB family protein